MPCYAGRSCGRIIGSINYSSIKLILFLFKLIMAYMCFNFPKNDKKSIRVDSFRRESFGFATSQNKNSRGMMTTVSRNFSEGGGQIRNLQQKLNRQGGSGYHWTQHCVRKMMFYGLTADRVKRVIRNPKRVEEGVAENTIAVMVSGANKNKSSEIWTMYQKRGNKKIVISAWRYPGISPVGKQIPIPSDILEELKKEGIMI